MVSFRKQHQISKSTSGCIYLELLPSSLNSLSLLAVITWKFNVEVGNEGDGFPWMAMKEKIKKNLQDNMHNTIPFKNKTVHV